MEMNNDTDKLRYLIGYLEGMIGDREYSMVVDPKVLRKVIDNINGKKGE